eukprot:Em0023g19a
MEAPGSTRRRKRPPSAQENDSTPLGKRQKSLKAVEVSKTFECNQISKEPVASSLTAGTEVKLAGQRSESEGIATVSTSRPVTHPSQHSVPGEVMVIGQGDVGQLGLGEEVLERKNPAPVVGMKESSTQVVCGGMHTVALSKEGKVYTWGCNDEGALGRKTSDGEEYLPGLVDKLDDIRVVQVSAGDSHTAALASDGRVYCWGVFRDMNGPFGLIGTAPSTQPALVYTSPSDRAVKIDSGSDHLVILSEQGCVYTLGCAEQGQLGRVAECFSSRGGRKGIDHLLHPDIVSVPRKRGKTIPKFTDVFCGSYHTFAYAKEDGCLCVWGLNNYGQLGTGDTDTRYQPQVIGVHEWFGEDSNRLGDLQIAGGQHHTVLCHNGSVYVMGRKEYGRLGLGTEGEESHLPQKVPTLTDIGSVAAGVACSYAVAHTGEAYSWEWVPTCSLGMGQRKMAGLLAGSGGRTWRTAVC